MKNIITLTNDFIVKNNVHSLPLTLNCMEKLCAKLGYRLLPVGNNAELIKMLGVGDVSNYIAFTYLHQDIKLVFFDETHSTGTRLFAIAHELGHICLKHNYQGAIGYSKATSLQEREADVFAYQLLAPLCVLKALNITRLKDIEQYTLLDTKRAAFVKLKLALYNIDASDNKVLRLHGVRRPIRKSNVLPSFTLALVSALIGAAIAFNISNAELPPAEESTATTNTLQYLKERSASQAAITSLTPNDIPETVYITPHGTKYHKENCFHLKNSSSFSAVSSANAITNGYTACKSCFK